MTGELHFPGSGIDNKEIAVSFGSVLSSVDAANAFSVEGNKHVPGLAMAYGRDGKILLLQVVPDPAGGLKLSLDAASTAQALLFLHPFVCVSDAEEAKMVLNRIVGLPEYDALRAYLTAQLAKNPYALGQQDSELDTRVSAALLAYLESYPSQISRTLSLQSAAQMEQSSKTSAAPEILPNVETGGLRLSWEGGDKFRMSNSYCRWVWCQTSSDSFMLLPSGDFLDAVKPGGVPFAPSTREFTYGLIPGGDTLRVSNYGYGFLQSKSNSWHNLSFAERRKAHYAGITTAIFELGRHSLAVITNVVIPAFGKQVPDLVQKDAQLISFIFNETSNLQRLDQYIAANDPWGASFWIVKQFLSRMVNSAAYREAFCTVTGIVLTEGGLGALARWLAAPVSAIMGANSITQGFRAVLGFNRSFFRTSFKAWREYTDFGGVQGYVGDKQSGKGIEGVSVKLLGDENNPMHPAHEQTTSNTGYYRFENIGVGEKSLSASKTGYKSATVNVVIAKNKFLDQDIILEKQTSGLAGKVVNEILQHHGVTPANFKGEVSITVREIGGKQQQFSTWTNDGVYGLTLTYGSWWIVAAHEDYRADSVRVDVTQTGDMNAPRDLVLKPAPTMTASITLDMENNGYDRNDDKINIAFPQVGLRKPQLHDVGCPYGGNPMLTMAGAGMNGSSIESFDFIEIGLAASMINQPDSYPVGGADYWGCSPASAPCAVVFGTTRKKCQLTEAIRSPMSFSFMQDPEDRGCNCGITAPGNIYLTAWGVELGDLVAGEFTLDLAGWKTCECGGNDTNNDGRIDTWNVSCARARVDVHFRFLVGTDYLITFKPSQTRSEKGPLD
ncbi:MAG TPA: carboxypeptidase regulatory-like domain-containing protein [bacterium]|nr:carboxypeptidase regulatory-like domain-containing protein [bacterium]